MSIIITKEGKQAVKVDRSSFENEKRLQEYIHANPETVPIYDIKENIRLLIVAREFSTGSGPIDAVGIDADGDIYLIETKLYTNQDKRFVVAQVLDYGAALSKYSRDITQFLSVIEEKIKEQFKVSLADKFKEYFALESDEELNEILENIKSNFLDGSFKFVVLMNNIPNRLKDLILFINASSDFTIYGVEFDFYRHENFEVIIPKILGAETSRKKEFTGSRKRGKANEEQFFTEVNENFKGEDFKIFMKLFEFGRSNADYSGWTHGKEDGSEFKVSNEKTSRRSLFKLTSRGILKLTIIKKNEKDNKTVVYLEGLEKIVKAFSWEKFLWHPKANPDKIYAKIPFESWATVVDEFKEKLSGLIIK